MEMPRTDANHERLHRLAGDWQGTERIHPTSWDPQGGEAQGRRRGRVALAGFALIVDYEQSRGGAPAFQGHGVYTWDPQAEEVVLHWFDVMGGGAEVFRGRWEGDVLRLASKGPIGWARLTYDLSRPGELGAGMELSQDGERWAPFFDARYQRAT